MFGFIGTGCRESDIGGISTNMNIVEPEGIDSIMNLYAPPFYNNIWREKSNSVKIPANLVYKISTKRDRQATILEVKEVQLDTLSITFSSYTSNDTLYGNGNYKGSREYDFFAKMYTLENGKIAEEGYMMRNGTPETQINMYIKELSDTTAFVKWEIPYFNKSFTGVVSRNDTTIPSFAQEAQAFLQSTPVFNEEFNEPYPVVNKACEIIIQESDTSTTRTTWSASDSWLSFIGSVGCGFINPWAGIIYAGINTYILTH